MNKPKIIKTAMENLKQLEDLRLNAYLCPAGKWSIGYGSRRLIDGSPVTPTSVIKSFEADYMLQKTCTTILDMLIAIHGYKLHDEKLMALISLVYNIGWTNYKKSSLCRAIEKGITDKETILELFVMWNKFTRHGKKIKSQGLTNRRIAEASLFNSCKP